MKKFLTLSLLALTALAVLVWLYNRPTSTTTVQPPTRGSLSIVTSFYPLYFFTTKIGGAFVSVHNLTPAGVEPHDYELTSQDLMLIQNSQLLILNGAGLESWAEKIKNTPAAPASKILIVGEALASATLIEDGAAQTDPHVWLSPPLAKQMVARILEALIKADATDADQYRTQALALTTRLDQLDSAYRVGLASCQQKDVITSHAAFHYLTSTYGLRQVPISGLSPNAEPTPQELARLADFAKQNKVHHIFFESLVSPDLANTLAREIGAQTLVLNPLEGLTPAEFQNGEDYFTAMEVNLKNLRLALDCK